MNIQLECHWRQAHDCWVEAACAIIKIMVSIKPDADVYRFHIFMRNYIVGMRDGSSLYAGFKSVCKPKINCLQLIVASEIKEQMTRFDKMLAKTSLVSTAKLYNLKLRLFPVYCTRTRQLTEVIQGTGQLNVVSVAETLCDWSSSFNDVWAVHRRPASIFQHDGSFIQCSVGNSAWWQSIWTELCELPDLAVSWLPV